MPDVTDGEARQYCQRRRALDMRKPRFQYATGLVLASSESSH